MAELQPANLTDFLLHFSSTFLYLPGPVMKALDPSFLTPKFSMCVLTSIKRSAWGVLFIQRQRRPALLHASPLQGNTIPDKFFFAFSACGPLVVYAKQTYSLIVSLFNTSGLKKLGTNACITGPGRYRNVEEK